MSESEHTPSPIMQFALHLAGVAAQEIIPRFQHTEVSFKSDGTPVTEADTEAERVMRELIRTTHPDHGIMGEEQDDVEGSGEFQWVLDPIDGTAAFALGLPTFGTLVSLLRNGHPVLGVINLPALKETIYAELGKGCWYLNKAGSLDRTKVSPRSRSLSEAYVSTTGLYNSNVDPRLGSDAFNMSALIQQAGKFRFIGDCVQHAMVIRGEIDAAFDTMMNPWDNAAIIPCLLEAGGTISDGKGNTNNLVHAESLLCSSNEQLHNEIIDTIRSV